MERIAESNEAVVWAYAWGDHRQVIVVWKATGQQTIDVASSVFSGGWPQLLSDVGSVVPVDLRQKVIDWLGVAAQPAEGP